ncbi:MAG: amylo-alpha-1,6-glucosidase [Phycisphaerae bacterium]
MDIRNEGYLNVYGPGQLLAFSALDGETSYENGIVARTSTEGVGICVKLPAEATVRFGNTPTATFLAGDCFDITTECGNRRGAFLDAFHLLIVGPCEVSDVADGLTVIREGDRTLLGSTARFDKSKLHEDSASAIADRRRWLDAQPVPPKLPDGRKRALVKAMSVMKTQVCSGEEPIDCRWTTPDRWPHRGCWLWDSAFHAIGWRHLDPAVARDAINAVFANQRVDGQIPIRTMPNDSHEFTQPPVLALAVMQVNDSEPDVEWLREVYPKLTAYVQWDLDNRDTDGYGLVEWAIEDNPGCRSGESGWDNSPRFDSARQLDAVDFNAMLALECEILSSLAWTLEDAEGAEKWLETYHDLLEKINERLWDEEAGLYMDADAETGERTGVISSAGLLPLICGAPSEAQAARLVDCLRDPEMFATWLPVPTIAVSDTENYSRDMWRGPVWLNINWLIAFGLRRYEQDDLADEIIEKTLNEVERWYEQCGSIFEFYDDRGEMAPPSMPRKGRNAPEIHPYHQVIHDYGWSSTLYVDMVFESLG